MRVIVLSISINRAIRLPIRKQKGAMAETKPQTPTLVTKRDRSPQFPYIGLAKAVERIEKIFEKAKRYDVRVADIASDWKLSPKSSSTDRNVAALIAYGLVEESGSREGKKIKVSENGWRILADTRPGAKDKLLAEAALKPPIIAEYARHWEEGRPDEAHALSQLKFEGGFTEEGAAQFLRVFDETIRFTKGVITDKKPDSDPAVDRRIPPADELPEVKLGDLIQWTSDGADQLTAPGRVMWISDDKSFVRIHGSPTGIPMSEITMVKSPEPASVVPPPQITGLAENSPQRDINVYLTGNRLEIIATVDAEGLKTLKEMLTKYEGILDLLRAPQQQKPTEQ
jgi:hypothetical protein